jgi:hypothetical protein
VSAEPSLSIVLATDALSTVEPVVRRLQTQTVAHGLELVIVTPEPKAARLETARLDGFAATLVVEVDDLVPLAAARAAGVRAATAPLVFLGETHSYPEPGWAEALIEAHTGDWAAVAPGFANANPAGALSWTGFLADYGAWLATLPAREGGAIPTYNTAYKRAALLGLGPNLERLLTTGDELLVRLREAGGRFLFHPASVIRHVNVTDPRSWLIERLLGGLLTASSRMEGWSAARRLLYAVGSPLIPAVVLARVAPGIRAARREHELPPATYPALAVGAALSALGELVGYLGAPTAWAEARMAELEIHRLRYART